MDSMDFQLRLKPVMDVSDIQGNLGTLQQYLNKLKLPDSMKSGFKETFASAEKEITKIQDILGKKTKTKGDVLGLEKSFGNLDKYFNKLANDMNKISGKKIFDGMKFSTPEMDQTIAKIKTLKEELKQQIPSNSIKEVNSAIKEMSTVSKSVSLERFKKAFASGDLTTAAKELQNLKANLNSFDEGGNTGKIYAANLKKLSEVFTNIDTGKIQSIKQELKQMDVNLEQLSTEQMEKLLNYFNTGVNDVRNMANGVKDYGDQVSRAEAQQVDLNNQISQLKDRVKYFFSLTNAVQLMRRALRDAFNQMKELDAVMTETAVVTSFDVGSMWDKLPEYTENANKLGVSIKGMYEASTLYYQQGLKTKEAMELSNETMKMARIAGMEAADATDRMTAALRGFNMELNETSAQRVNDVYSKLAAISASDTDEISSAMTKTASIAASAGMEFETTSAFLTQMIETTREAPENLGTAMKTIVARFTEMKNAPGDVFTDLEGEEVNVNKVDAALRSVGVSLKDSSGQFRDLDDVFIELAERWDSLDVMQQRYIATTAAGSRQQSRFIAMMSNYDRTMELVSAATGSAGASQLQYEKTLDSLETKLTKLKNAWTTFTQTLLDNTLVKAGIDILTLLLEAINKISGALDGLADGTGAIASLGMAILAFKGGKSLLNKGLDSILTSFLGKVKVTANIAGQQAAFEFNKGAEQGNAATKGSSIFSGVGSAGSFDAGKKQFRTNVSNKWNNARYYGRYDDFLSNQKMVGEEILNTRYSGGIEDIRKLGKSYDLSGKDLDKFTDAVKNGGPELDKYTNKIAKNKAGITDQAKASGKSIGQMAAVAAAIVVVTNAIKLVDNAIKTSSEKIAEISTALEETNSNIAENQEILDNYQDTKNTYDDIVDSLDELREGTAEWNQNLLKVNSQTQEIISKYPELIKYVKEVNGAQVMSAEGWAAYQDNVTKTLQKQYGIQSGLNNQLTNAQLTKNLEGMEYSDGKSVATTTRTFEEQSQIKTGTTIGGVAGGAAGVVGGGILGGMAAGAIAGTAAGTAIPGLGNAVGLIVGAIVGAVGAAIGAGIGTGIGAIGTESGIDPRDAIKLGTLAGDEGFVAENATTEQIDAFITKAKSAGIALKDLEDVIREDGAAFDEWVQTNLQAELQKESQRDALISNTIAQNDKLMNSDVLSYIKDTVDISFDDYDERFATALEEAEDLGEDQLKTQYGTLMNLTADEIEAKLESKELSEETMQQAIAANNVAEDLASTMEGLITVFEDLKEVASEVDLEGNKTEDAKLANAILHAVSGEGKGMTKSDIDLFNDKLGGKNGIANLQKQFKEEKISEKDLTKKINTILSEVDTSLDELGLSAKDFIQNLTTADNLSQKLAESYGQNSVNQANKTLGKDNVLGTSGSGYSIGAQDTIAKAFSRGETKAEDKTIKSIFSNLEKQVTEENVDQYNNSLESMDVSDSKSIKDTMEALKDLGFNVDGMTESLIKATKATHEYTAEEIRAAEEQAQTARQIVTSKGVSNTVYSEEEYQTLTNKGTMNTDKFIPQVVDGVTQYVYIGENILSVVEDIEAHLANKKSGDAVTIDKKLDVIADMDTKDKNGKTRREKIDAKVKKAEEAKKVAPTNQLRSVVSKGGPFAMSSGDKRGSKGKYKSGFTASNNFGPPTYWIQKDLGDGRAQKYTFSKTDGQKVFDALGWGTFSGSAMNNLTEKQMKRFVSVYNRDVGDTTTTDAESAKKDAKDAMLKALNDNKLNEDGKLTGKSSYEAIKEAYDKYFGDGGEYSKDTVKNLTATDYSNLGTDSLVDFIKQFTDSEDTDSLDKASEGLIAQARAYEVSEGAIYEYQKAVEAGNDGLTTAEKKIIKEKAALLQEEIARKKSIKALKQHYTALKAVSDKYGDKATKDNDEYLERLAVEMNLDPNDKNVDFIRENFALIQSAIDGNVNSMIKLRELMEQEYGFTLHADGKIDGLKNATDEAKKSTEAFILSQAKLGHYKKKRVKIESGGTYAIPTYDESGNITGVEIKTFTNADAKGYVDILVDQDESGYEDATSGGGSSGGGGGSSSPQKNTKKTWHYNRDVKSEKRQNQLADFEHEIAMEQSKQIPNLKTIINLNKKRYDLLKKDAKLQKANYDASLKKENQLWKIAKKKGYNKLLNKDGTVNLKAYNSKEWSEKAKEAFDEWESDWDDTREYTRSSKEAWQESKLQVAELENARSEYTKLTNLAEKYENISDKITKRQSEYNRELNKTNTSGKSLVSNLIEQENHLKNQLKLQKNIQAAAKEAAKDYRKQSGVGKYVSANLNTGEYTINYDKINAEAKKGIDIEPIEEAIDAYVEYLDQIAEASMEQNSILDEIDNTIQERLQSVVDLQTRVREAIIQSRQEEIDALSTIDSSINDTNSKILSAVQDNISKLRQDRKNEQTEEDLADKQTRLAYLRQYTGTGNAAEIAKLEDEIEKGEESYTDTLIDQKINELQKQNDEASQQRQRQIKIMEKQLQVDQENGKITAEARDLMTDGILNGVIDTSSDLYKLLALAGGWASMSPEEFQQALNEIEGMAAQFSAYNIGNNLVGTRGSDYGKGSTISFQDKNGKTIRGGKVVGEGAVDVTDNKGITSHYTGVGQDADSTIVAPNKRTVSGQVNIGNGTPIYSSSDGNKVMADTDKGMSTYRGGAYNVIDETKDMYKIQYYDDKGNVQTGWVLKENVSKDRKLISKNDIVKLNGAGQKAAKKNGFIGINGNKGYYYVVKNDNGVLTLKQTKDGKKTFTVDEKNATFLTRSEGEKATKNLQYLKDDRMLYKFAEGIKLSRKGRNDKEFKNATAKQVKAILGKKMSFVGKDKKGFLQFRTPGKGAKDAATWKTKSKTPTKIKQFKTGGLADFTGPAWLDGTKTKPEIILNQKDTENFIQLKNILADVMKGVPSKSNQNNGDSYAEIHINVEKMTSDYDVDKVAKRVKKILNEDGRYRTVNQINTLR